MAKVTIKDDMGELTNSHIQQWYLNMKQQLQDTLQVSREDVLYILHQRVDRSDPNTRISLSQEEREWLIQKHWANFKDPRLPIPEIERERLPPRELKRRYPNDKYQLNPLPSDWKKLGLP